MAKKASTTVNKPATSTPQLIKELIAMGITSYKTPELEFTVIPAVVADKALPKVPVETLDDKEEPDLDQKAFEAVFGKKVTNV